MLNGNKAYNSGAILSHAPKVWQRIMPAFQQAYDPARLIHKKETSIYVVTGVTLIIHSQVIQGVGGIVLQLGNRSSMLLVRRILLLESPCLKCRLNGQSTLGKNALIRENKHVLLGHPSIAKLQDCIRIYSWKCLKLGVRKAFHF